MSDQQPEGAPADFAREEMQSALFAQLVIQQSSMAMMLLGKTPHPEKGKTVQNLEAARMFIDQLEMLEAKTRGNLNKTEESLLKQTLMALRMAFVESVEHPQPQPESKPAAAAENKTAPAENTGAEESKKRFSKKFSL